VRTGVQLLTQGIHIASAIFEGLRQIVLKDLRLGSTGALGVRCAHGFI
jgi:hypothetical protein